MLHLSCAILAVMANQAPVLLLSAVHCVCMHTMMH